MSLPTWLSARAPAPRVALARPAWLAALLYALGAGIALGWLLAALPLPQRQMTVDVGAEEAFRAEGETGPVRNFFGFYEPETAGRTTFRWTYDWARMVFSNAYQLGRPLRLDLRLCGCRPGGPQPVVRLELDHRAALDLPTSAGYRRYVVLAPPPPAVVDSDLYIELFSDTFTLTGNPRRIGVQMDAIAVHAPAGPALPGRVALALAGAGALVGAAAMRVRDRAAHRVVLGALIGGPVLALLAYRPQPLPPAALVLAMLWGVLLAALARPGRAATALGLVAALLALPLANVLLGGWLVDDAFISLRYAQQWLAGNGLVFNPGERVEGYTNFLWTMVLAAALATNSDVLLLARLLPLLIGQATIALCFVVGRRLPSLAGAREPLAATIAPLLLATSGAFLAYTARGSGMETALFTFLALAGAGAWIAGWPLRAGALFGLAALTRPEGMLLLAVTVGFGLLDAPPEQRMRAVGRTLAAFLAIFLPYYLWRFSYYGLPLPNTFYVKVGASGSQLARGLRYAGDYWAPAAPAWVAGALLLGLVAWRRSGSIRPATRWANADRSVRRAPVVYLALLTGVYFLYVIAVGGDWMAGSRFIVPLVPLLALLAQWGLAWIARGGGWHALAAGSVLALALALQAGQAGTTSAFDPASPVWRENTTVARRREVGRWLAAHTPPDTLVAAEAAGALAYYSRRPVLDILGLNDRHIASMNVATMGRGKPGHEKTDIPYVLDRAPAIIPYFAAPYFADQPRFWQAYRREEQRGPEGHPIMLYRRIAP